MRPNQEYCFRLIWLIVIVFSGLIVPTASVKAKLSVAEIGATYARLIWIAPGDDLDSGVASIYDIRSYKYEITEQNWDSAQSVTFPSEPSPAGQMDSITVGNLDPGTVYFFAVKTADKVLNWSGISVVSDTTVYIDSNGVGTILISEDTVSEVTTTTATVQWKTDIPSTSQVIYGPGRFDYASATDSSLDSVHSVTLINLSPDQAYVCQVVSGDAQGNLTGGRTLSFMTDAIATNTPNDVPVPVSLVKCVNRQPTLKVVNIDTNLTNYYQFEVSIDSLFSIGTVISGVVTQESGSTTGWKVESVLSSGLVYYWRANVNDGDYCANQKLIVDPITCAYPNPFVFSKTDHTTFVNIPANRDLSILNLNGGLVYRWLNITNGTISWDGTNSKGLRVASGVYLWYIEGTDIKGKLILTR